MSKENLIHMITLLDTGSYRHIYKHEPPKFRDTLYKIYNKLDEEDLETIFNLRSK